MELEAPEGSPLVNNCYWWNIVLTMVVGFFVNGPYSLITTAVSAELGQHPSLQVRDSLPTANHCLYHSFVANDPKFLPFLWLP